MNFETPTRKSLDSNLRKWKTEGVESLALDLLKVFLEFGVSILLNDQALLLEIALMVGDLECYSLFALGDGFAMCPP